MLNNLRTKFEAQNLKDLYTSSLMFISGGGNAQQAHPSRLQLKTDYNDDDDEDLIEISERGGGGGEDASARTFGGLISRNFINTSEDVNQRKESINLRAASLSANQRVLVDDIGLFSDLELRPSRADSVRAVNERSHSHSHSNHSHSHSHHHNQDVEMLNPNFDDSSEAIQIENNHNKLIASSLVRDRTNGSQSSSLDDHCHVSVNLDKDRNKTVWYKLITVFILCVMFMVGEIIGGVLAKSISIQTDAAHMAADIAGFFFSIVAIYVSEKEPTRRLSFGYYRSEVLGALFSILIIWLLTGVLVYLAIVRVITNDFDIEPVAMLATASCGVVFNIIMFFILHTNRCFGDQLKHHGHSHSGDGHHHSHSASTSRSHSHSHSHANNNIQPTPKFTTALSGPINDNYAADHTSAYMDSDEVDIIDASSSTSHGHTHDNDSHKKHHGNINLRAAAIHVIGDFIQSIGVLIAALIIYFKPEYKLADPICTFLFSAMVMSTTAPIIKDIYFVLMEGLPLNLNYNLIAADLCSLNNVKNAHNLHIWCLTMDKFVLAVHLVTGSLIAHLFICFDEKNPLNNVDELEISSFPT